MFSSIGALDRATPALVTFVLVREVLVCIAIFGVLAWAAGAAHALSRAAREHAHPDLLNARPLAPLARCGTRMLLFWVLMLSLQGPFLLAADTRFSVEAVPIFVVVSLILHSSFLIIIQMMPEESLRSSMDPAQRRNRALTDVFEPGSAVKPFTLAAAIDRGLFNSQSRIDTTPGWFKVSGYPVKDVRNYGELDLAGILRKSSNVGASRIAQSMKGNELWQSFSDYGFGETPGVSFPAESSGYFSHYSLWQPLDHATMGFGYGLSADGRQPDVAGRRQSGP